MSILTNMAQYETNKLVRAGRILTITRERGKVRIDYLDANNCAAWTYVDEAWQTKHQPEVGWYLVQYHDGYLSASPAEAFEEAAIRIDHN
jgi:hypothetical protein